MGTKIQATGFFDLDGSSGNGMRYSYHENRILKNEDHPHFALHYSEKVRQTILEHESVFRSQLQELHRLYGRQRELMNEIKRREVSKEDVKDETSFFFSPDHAKRPWKHSAAGCLSISGTSSRLYPRFVGDNSVSVFPPAQVKTSLRSCEPLVLNSNNLFNLGSPADVAKDKQMQEIRFSKLPVIESISEKWVHQGSYGGVPTSQHKANTLIFDLYDKRNDNPVRVTDGFPGRLMLSRGENLANSCSKFSLATKDLFQHATESTNEEKPLSIVGLRNERSGKEHLSDDYSAKRRFDEHSSVGLDISASISRKRKKIFGVVISEEDDPSNMQSNLDQKAGNHDHVFSSSWIDNSFIQSLHLGCGNSNDGKNERSKEDMKPQSLSLERSSCLSDVKEKWLEGCSSVGLNFVETPHQHKTGDPNGYVKNVDNTSDVLKKDSEQSHKFGEGQNNQQNSKGGLPWFLKNSQVGGDFSKNSYFMNLDSLQHCSQKFFGKAETPDGTSHTWKNKEEVLAPGAALGGISEVNDDGRGCKEIDGFPISNLRQCIDLNLSLDEEGSPSLPFLPTDVLTIAATEIDLEASAVVESETDASPEEIDSECDVAAEAMIAISLSKEKNDTADESKSMDSLKWLAGIVSSHSKEEFIPDGMDYFEFMTLKLEDTKKEHYHYEPLVLNVPSDNETGATQTTKRSRRGQLRRGRLRKDFQRDILPGLSTLSRLEVTEDFQAFNELLKAEGSTWSHRSSSRNGRGGRKRSTPPRIKTLCSTEAQQPICQLEGRSLAGWGKRTRRLPRQRCPNAILSFPVRC